jgi:flagellar hook-associated protein FlgK
LILLTAQQLGRKLASMNSALGYAVAGMNAAAKRFAIRAQNVVNVQTEGYLPVLPVQTSGAGGPMVQARRLPPEYTQQKFPGTDFVVPQVSLETELSDILLSKIAYKASATLIRTQREFDDALLDIVA